VYGPAHDDKREQFLSELSGICAKDDVPTLLGGDFNILRYSSEKNKLFSGNRYCDLFNWIINSYELREIEMSGEKYTWSNNQAEPTLEKLDRILVNNKWDASFPLSTVRKIPRFVSDHNPLVLDTENEQVQKVKTFCFETSWIKHPDFLPKMEEIWSKPVQAVNAVSNWCIKINRVKNS
jgi:endonuclease/exonuclease/phosphatase family metal-dependent hydrolase